MKKLWSGLAIALFGAVVSTSANATLWEIDKVVKKQSVIHKSSQRSLTSGRILAKILSGSGYYDDVTGDFSAELVYKSKGNRGGVRKETVAVKGNLLFAEDGLLETHGLIEDAYTTYGFLADKRFNSFDKDTGHLSLWGADGFRPARDRYSRNTKYGIDLLIKLKKPATPVSVPEPGTWGLMLLGLIGLGLCRRKST